MPRGLIRIPHQRTIVKSPFTISKKSPENYIYNWMSLKWQLLLSILTSISVKYCLTSILLTVSTTLRHKPNSQWLPMKIFRHYNDNSKIVNRKVVKCRSTTYVIVFPYYCNIWQYVTRLAILSKISIISLTHCGIRIICFS